MYYRIVQYMYFTIAFILCSIIGIALLQDLQAQGLHFFYLFTILCIPVFDRLIEYMRGEKFFQFEMKKITGLNIIKISIIMGVSLILIKMGVSIGNIATLSSLLLLVVFGLDSRIAFLVSLVLFLYIGFFLLLGNKVLAESLSIYAYYFLIIGVLVEILQSFTMKKIKDET